MKKTAVETRMYLPYTENVQKEALSKYHVKIRIWQLLVGLMAGSGLFSLLFLFPLSLRLDEAQSLWQTSLSVPKILEIIAQDVHVPFFHIILHGWQLVFGNGAEATRILSLTFFLLTIPFIFNLTMEAFNRSTTAILVATLTAFSPFLLWYSSEVRMYTLITLLTINSHYLFLKLQTNQSRRPWILFTIVSLIGIYTHYFFWLVLIAQGVFFLSFRSTFPRTSFRNFIIVATLLFASISPWILFVISNGSANNTQPRLQTPSSIDIFNTYSQFLFGFQNDSVNTTIVSLWPLTALIIFLVIQRNWKNNPRLLYFVFVTLIPVIIAFTLSITIRPVFLSRYLIIIVPSLYILIAFFLTQRNSTLEKILQTAFILSMILALWQQTFSQTTPVKENYREVSIFLEKQATQQDIIALSAPFTIYPFQYYYNGAASVHTLPAWNRFRDGTIPTFNQEEFSAEVKTLATKYQNIWLILSYDQGYEEQVKTYFDTHFPNLASHEFSPKLRVYEYKLDYY